MDALLPLASGLLFALVFYVELMAVGEWVGERIGELIVWLLTGEWS